MHQFEPGPEESRYDAEARAVVQAWLKRQQAHGNSVGDAPLSSLAESLGMPEEEVKRLIEDERVRRRSEEMAANILAEERARRKRLDSSAALGAAITVVLVAIIVGAFFFLRPLVGQQDQGMPVAAPVFHPEPPPVPSFDADEVERSALEAERAALEARLEQLETQTERAELKAEIESLQREIERLDASLDGTP